MKQVAVLGLGDFGKALVRQLKQNHVDVFAVDRDRSRVEALRDELDHLVIADITQATALDKLNLQSMDAVVIATSSPLPASILAVLRLRELGVQRIIAKAENQDHVKVLASLGVTEVVNPDQDSAQRLANKISWSSVVEMIELSAGYSIMEVATPDFLVGKTLATSQLREKFHVEVLGVRSKPGMPLQAIPSPSHEFIADATMIVFGANEHLKALRTKAEKS